MSCRVYLPSFNDDGETDEIIFEWLDNLPMNEYGDAAFNLESNCIFLVFERDDDATAFKLRFKL